MLKVRESVKMQHLLTLLHGSEECFHMHATGDIACLSLYILK